MPSVLLHGGQTPPGYCYLPCIGISGRWRSDMGLKMPTVMPLLLFSTVLQTDPTGFKCPVTNWLQYNAVCFGVLTTQWKGNETVLVLLSRPKCDRKCTFWVIFPLKSCKIQEAVPFINPQIFPWWWLSCLRGCVFQLRLGDLCPSTHFCGFQTLQ